MVRYGRVGHRGARRGGGLSGDRDVEPGLDEEVALVRRAVARGLLTKALERSIEVARDVDDYALVEEVPIQPATASINQLLN